LTGKDEIAKWFESGVEGGHRYMMIGVDTFDRDEYPVYVNTISEGRIEAKKHEKFMEIYDLQGNMQEQLKQRRAWAFKLNTGVFVSMAEKHIQICDKCKLEIKRVKL